VTTITTMITLVEQIIAFIFVSLTIACQISVEKREKRLIGIMLKKMNENFPMRKQICRNADIIGYLFALPVSLTYFIVVCTTK